MSDLGGKPMTYVYVASRSDGMHKIGVTGCVESRCITLSKMCVCHDCMTDDELRAVSPDHRRFDVDDDELAEA